MRLTVEEHAVLAADAADSVSEAPEVFDSAAAVRAAYAQLVEARLRSIEAIAAHDARRPTRASTHADVEARLLDVMEAENRVWLAEEIHLSEERQKPRAPPVPTRRRHLVPVENPVLVDRLDAIRMHASPAAQAILARAIQEINHLPPEN